MYIFFYRTERSLKVRRAVNMSFLVLKRFNLNSLKHYLFCSFCQKLRIILSFVVSSTKPIWTNFLWWTVEKWMFIKLSIYYYDHWKWGSSLYSCAFFVLFFFFFVFHENQVPNLIIGMCQEIYQFKVVSFMICTSFKNFQKIVSVSRKIGWTFLCFCEQVKQSSNALYMIF